MVDHLTARPLALQIPDPAFAIRAIMKDDAAALLARCWQHHTAEEAVEIVRRIKSAEGRQRGIGLVAEDAGGGLVGYGQMLSWSTSAEISDLIVAQEFRGQGIGTAIIQHLVQYGLQHSFRCVEIGAALSNPRALALYRRLGFLESYSLLLRLATGMEHVQYLRLTLDESPLRDSQ